MMHSSQTFTAFMTKVAIVHVAVLLLLVGAPRSYGAADQIGSFRRGDVQTRRKDVPRGNPSLG